MSTTTERVTKAIIDKLGIESSQVTMEARFTTDLGADSLDVVELIMDFEKEFNISIPDEQAEKIETVGQAVEYIDKAIGQLERPNVAS
jgi:acyl carrier protein